MTVRISGHGGLAGRISSPNSGTITASCNGRGIPLSSSFPCCTSANIVSKNEAMSSAGRKNWMERTSSRGAPCLLLQHREPAKPAIKRAFGSPPPRIWRCLEAITAAVYDRRPVSPSARRSLSALVVVSFLAAGTAVPIAQASPASKSAGCDLTALSPATQVDPDPNIGKGVHGTLTARCRQPHAATISVTLWMMVPSHGWVRQGINYVAGFRIRANHTYTLDTGFGLGCVTGQYQTRASLIFPSHGKHLKLSAHSPNAAIIC